MKTLISMFVFLILIGCSSDEPSKLYDENPIQQDPQDPPDPDSENQDVIIADNVVVILDDNSENISSESDLENGIYSIEFLETPPEILVGDIIVGNEGYGFLRKVSSIAVAGNIVSMETTQASLREVFEQATIEFSTDPDYISKSSKNSKINHLTKDVNRDDVLVIDFSDISSISPYFNIQGDVTFDPNFYLKVDYRISDEGTMIFKYDGSIFNIDGTMNISTPGAVIVEDDVKVLYKPPPEVYVQNIAGIIDLTYVINTEVIAILSLRTSDAVDITGGFSDDIVLSFNTENSNENWIDQIDIRTAASSKGVILESVANVSQNLTITERVSFEVQGITGAFMQPYMSEDFIVNYNEGSGDWDSELDVGLNFTYGIENSIFGFGEFSNNKSSSDNIWNGPVNLEIESGNNQTGVYYGENDTSPLEEPLKVLVVDSDGVPIKNVIVHYEVKTGGGSVDIPDVVTDASGFAETNWTLGNESEDQTVEATVLKADGNFIGDSPIEFEATMIDLSGEWVIVDTSSNCPEGVNYRFSFDPNTNSINIIGEDTSEITGTSFSFDIEELYLDIDIASIEEFEYICEEDEIYYETVETGDADITGFYDDQEFTGGFRVSFDEQPWNPCVNNFSCSGGFRMFKD